MKLITILFLCSRLLPSLTQESSEEIDCNDQDVFKAVDTALTKYNSGNKSGNQFVLYRVTEVARMVSELCLTLGCLKVDAGFFQKASVSSYIDPFMSFLNIFMTVIFPLSKQFINPEYSLEALMLRLKFQYFGHLM